LVQVLLCSDCKFSCKATTMQWLESMLSNTECCSQRNPGLSECRISDLGPHRGGVGATRDSRGSLQTKSDSQRSANVLPSDFFFRLAEHCVNDPQIARRIDDDRTCPLIWGEARSLRFLFLQMCIRDNHDRCREIWHRLSEFERREYMSVYHYGPPSRDFFIDITVNNEEMLRDISDCGSSDSGRSDSGRSDISFQSIASNLAQSWNNSF